MDEEKKKIQDYALEKIRNMGEDEQKLAQEVNNNAQPLLHIIMAIKEANKDMARDVASDVIASMAIHVGDNNDQSIQVIEDAKERADKIYKNAVWKDDE